MRAVLQITSRASVSCEGKEISSCGRGMCILIGLREDDTKEIADLFIDKILKMRIFSDENGKINLSALSVGADLLVISNFTLYGNTSSRRPDFLKAMKFQPAKELYEYVLTKMQEKADEWRISEEKRVRIFPGVFGGDMKLEIYGDGPVTILLDSDQM